MGSRENLVQMFVRQAGKFADRTALRSKKEGSYRDISWDQFFKSVRSLSLGLKSLGVKRSDKICLLSENRPEWAYADLAILALGAVNVPIYPTSAVKDIEYIVNHAEAEILIISTREQYEKIKDLPGQCPKIKKMIVIDASVKSSSEVVSFDEIVSKGEGFSQQEAEAWNAGIQSIDPEDLASIIYTSGTTGEPKGVMLTHWNFMSNVIASAQALPLTDKESALSFLPLSHVFERMAGYYFMIYHGAVIAYAENINTVSDNLKEISPTVVTSVPRLYEKMYAKILDQVQNAPVIRRQLFYWSLNVGRTSAPYRRDGKAMPFLLKLQYSIAKALVFKKVKAGLGGRLKFFISGGAPLSKEIAEFFYAADVLILEGYGLTETSPVATVNKPDSFKFGTVGHTIPGVEVKIASDGEILIKGPNIMKGYYRKEKETEEAIRDGWFFTGDIGEFDPEGFLKITDRKKDLIVTSGGKNVAPQKIENLLVADKYIAQICVCGDKKNYLTALVVPDFAQIEKYAQFKGISFQTRKDLIGNDRIKDLIQRRIEARMEDFANYEKIKYFTLLNEEFTLDKGELTPTLKLKRKVINEKYRAVIGSMYEVKSS